MTFIQPVANKLVFLFIVLEVKQSSTIFSEQRSGEVQELSECVE